MKGGHDLQAQVDDVAVGLRAERRIAADPLPDVVEPSPERRREVDAASLRKLHHRQGSADSVARGVVAASKALDRGAKMGDGVGQDVQGSARRRHGVTRHHADSRRRGGPARRNERGGRLEPATGPIHHRASAAIPPRVGEGAARAPFGGKDQKGPVRTFLFRYDPNIARRFQVIGHIVNMSLRVATYCRVSTDRQTTEHQRPEVEQLARQRGEVVATYEERASSKKARPEYARMLKDARRGMFDAVIIWAIDRLGRTMINNMQDIAELDRLGVRVVSVKEAWMDTSGPTRPLLIAIASWMAETEHARIVERIHAGLATARRKGKRLGRKPTRVDLDEVARLQGEGLSTRATALKMGLTLSTLQRAIERGTDPKPLRKVVQQTA